MILFSFLFPKIHYKNTYLLSLMFYFVIFEQHAFFYTSSENVCTKQNQIGISTE